MSHLGTRVSALLDGRLAPALEERLWAHVHRCHPCRDLVEREGWVKSRLAAWSMDDTAVGGRVPERLKSTLLDPSAAAPAPWPGPARGVSRNVVVLGGGLAGAVGATVVGVLALGVAPADAPARQDRLPVSQLSGPASDGWTSPRRPRLEDPLAPRTSAPDGARGTMAR